MTEQPYIYEVPSGLARVHADFENEVHFVALHRNSTTEDHRLALNELTRLGLEPLDEEDDDAFEVLDYNWHRVWCAEASA